MIVIQHNHFHKDKQQHVNPKKGQHSVKYVHLCTEFLVSAAFV